MKGGWLTKIRVALAVGKVALGGKPGKVLEKIEGGLDVAEKVRELIPQKPKKRT